MFMVTVFILLFACVAISQGGRMTSRLYHHRGMMKDRDAKQQLRRRQKSRDEIERRQLAQQLGIDPKEVT